MRVPGELTQYKQWVLWRRAEVNGRKLKLPISPWSGKAASCDKPETWASFRHACFALRKYKVDGIGFVFTPEDPFCGIDLDKCRSRRGSIDAHCLELVRKLHSYTELSPSGEGLHIIVKASMLENGRRTEGIEIYAAGRYFTMTGNHLSGTPDCIEDRQGELDSIIRERFPVTALEREAVSRPPRTDSKPDAEIIGRALRAKSGARFQKLWAGDTSDYDGDHSRADAALCRMLSFWTRGNTEQVDRLFRMSGLMRDKWNRKTGEETYGARTIRLFSRP
jgi:putative DNA primase/helicase